MKITIVTLYRGDTADHYVGAIQGSLTHVQRLAVADRLGAVFGEDEEDVEYEGRYVYFREVDLAPAPDSFKQVLGIDDEDYVGDGETATP